MLRIIVLTLCIYLFSCTEKYDNLLEKNYTKKDYRIAMRDGVRLYTTVYKPKDTSQKYPILMWRTPYSVKAYGDNNYISGISTWDHLIEEGFIFVFQDVRGKYMSEGQFVNMRPYSGKKTDTMQTDETTDTYDTIEWLLNNIEDHNSRVGQWGISYPGFYAAMATIDVHPALKAVSPQAPIADWFTGDDMHHNGALCLPIAFRFFASFGVVRDSLTQKGAPRFIYPVQDDYKFYLDMGPLKNFNEEILHYKIPFWNHFMAHGTYDEFWQSRNTRPHFNDIKPAVMVVGGWYDAENCYGALETYKAIERKNKENKSMLVMGPWSHGGWVRSDGRSLGNIDFKSYTGDFYRFNIELPFFNYYLKDKGHPVQTDAHIFETGMNRWRRFNTWPPADSEIRSIYLGENGNLSFISPQNRNIRYAQYISDPDKPVPFRSEITIDWPRYFLVDDQRFASRRTDVLVFQTDTLKDNITMAGPVEAQLYCSTSGTDSDWIVKLIDVFPDSATGGIEKSLSAYQMLVRAEIMRAKFRNSYEFPEPMEPGKITKISFFLNDICHTFKKGHRIMVHVQSSWFPLFDRNPQKFVDIYRAGKSDFQKVTQKVYFSSQYPSQIKFHELK